jgi:hypothetical protein
MPNDMGTEFHRGRIFLWGMAAVIVAVILWFLK